MTCEPTRRAHGANDMPSPVSAASCRPYLKVSADGKSLTSGAEITFLNGLNLAWVRFPDFGASSGAETLPTYCGVEDAMRYVRSNGGNALRIWMLEEPSESLTWDSDGHVTGLASGVIDPRFLHRCEFVKPEPHGGHEECAAILDSGRQA